MQRWRNWIGALGAAGILLTAVFGTAAQAQFGRIVPRDVQNVMNDAQGSDEGCGEGEKKTTGGRVLGGIFGRSARRAANRSSGCQPRAGLKPRQLRAIPTRASGWISLIL